jgi:lambda family phage minor tail protein L
MAGEGKNKVASSLLDLQPTAVLELLRVYPDRINNPSIFLGFHGGAIFNGALKWQGLQYVPLAIESEGFDVLGDGKMARPKIRVANKNNIITNMLQNYQDFKNAKVVRKKVQVKFLDDDNFDGGNPFGTADSKAELLNEEWIMGRKTQESKIFVEFELNSPLDLENFSVNSRGIQARFCSWQYRGEGCRYQGLPIEREDGAPFQAVNGDLITPNYTPATESQNDFWSDPAIAWNINKEYSAGDIVIVESPTILLPVGDTNEKGKPLKTVYVSVANSNKGNKPEKNPSYWQKDGCTKRLRACQKRFNTLGAIAVRSAPVEETFPSVRFSGIQDFRVGRHGQIRYKGCFHTTESGVTGVMDPRKAWTLMGWANMNESSPRGAGIFSTSPAEADSWPGSRYLNINRNSIWNFRDREEGRVIQAQYIGYYINDASKADTVTTAWRTRNLALLQPVGQAVEEWNQYIVRHNTGTQEFLENDAVIRDGNLGENTEDFTTRIQVLVNGEQTEGRTPRHLSAGGLEGTTRLGPDHLNDRRRANWRIDEPERDGNQGNFASFTDRVAGYPGYPSETLYPCLPQTFMIGAQEFWRFPNTWPDSSSPNVQNTPAAQLTTMNGQIGTWALWNRVLNEEELEFLRKPVIAPHEATTYLNYVPRLYGECTGRMSTLTGGTGDGLPAGTAPLLYGSGTLIAWWDGTTGNIGSASHPTGALLDVHTGGHHLTGSGDYLGATTTYSNAPVTVIPNPSSSPYPRFGGFPGTDGFRYGRTT